MLLNIPNSHLSVQDPAQRLKLRKVNRLLLTQNELIFGPINFKKCVCEKLYVLCIFQTLP